VGEKFGQDEIGNVLAPSSGSKDAIVAVSRALSSGLVRGGMDAAIVRLDVSGNELLEEVLESLPLVRLHGGSSELESIETVEPSPTRRTRAGTSSMLPGGAKVSPFLR